MKSLYIRLSLVFCGFLLAFNIVAQTPVSFKVAFEPSTNLYTVYMKSTTAFSATAAPSSQIGTSQVSLVVPHGMFPNLVFSGGGVTSVNGTWALNTRVDSPTVNTSKDYLFFGYSNSPKFDMPANVDIPLFSFSSTNCTGLVSLYDISSDLFQVPNVENANPGNNMSILGNGGDAYGGNYGSTANCVLSPDLVTSIGTIPALTVGSVAQIPVTVSNIGLGSGSGPITSTFTVPSGLNPPIGSFTSNDWSCNVNLQSVTCTNPNSIPSGGVSPFSVPVTPTASSVGTNPIFNVAITPLPNESNSLNNSSAPTTSPSPVAPAASILPLSYKIDYDTNTGKYTVYMKTSVAFSATTNPSSQISTAQASVVIPHGMFPGLAVGSGGITSINGTWTLNTRVNAPSENPSKDYLFFAYSTSPKFEMPANVDIPLFCFTSNNCLGDVKMYENPSDPFQVGNSANANPGNNMTILGNGGETYYANYGGPAICPVTFPDLTTTLGPIPTLTAGQTANIPVLVSNIGTAPAVGPISTSITIPAGINPPSASFTNNGWTCAVNLQVVTCTNPNTIANGGSSSFSVPVVPSVGSVGSLPLFTASTNPTPSETNTTNNAATPVAPTTAVQPAQPTVCTNTVDCNQGVRYGLKLGSDGITYTVYMKSANAYSGAFSLISTAQATVVVPTGTQITSPVGQQAGMVWTANTRINQPSENPTADFISFGFNQSASPVVFNIPAETEIPLFSFQRTSACSGNVRLFETSDAFQGISTSTNPGNQMTVVGNGQSNAWVCNYTCPISCPVASLTLVKTASSNTIYQNVPFDYNFTLTNTGTAETSGIITLTDVLPTGLQYVSFTGAGWTCGAVGQTVTCTYASPIATGSANSKTLSLKVNPTQLGAMANTATVSGGGSAMVSSSPCATCPVGSTNITVLANPVDLSIAIAQPATLIVGQATNVAVTISNITAGSANGPINASLSFSNGLTAPASFNGGNGWTCSTISNQVSCTNPNALAGNQSSSISIPVTPSNSNVGQSILFLANVAQAANETNLSNNSAYIFTNSAVQSSDLIVSFGTMPNLSPNQSTTVPITVSNIGQASANGALSVQVTLPSGVSLNSASLPSGWSLVSTVGNPNGSTEVTLSNTNTNGLISGGSLLLNLPISLSNNVSGTLNFFAAVNSIPSESNVLNNSATASANVGSTDLSINVTVPGSVIIGQNTNLNVVISNLGTNTTSGAISVSVNLPAGVVLNASQLPLGWVLQSSVVNTNGSTTLVLTNNTATISPAGQLNFNLPVTFTGNTVNQTLNIGLTVLPIVGETNTANNQTNVNVSPSSAQITFVVTPPAIFIGGQSNNINIVFNNTGNQPYTGPMTTQITLPAGVNFGTLPSGWVIQSQVTNPNGSITFILGNPNVSIPVGGSVQFIVPVLPSTTINGQNVNIVIVTPIVPGYATPNTSQTLNLVVVVPNTAYITVNVGAPSPSLSVGQTSIIPVTFTNIGSATSNGGLSVQLTLPAGVVLSSSQLPIGWVVSSSTAGPNGTTVLTLVNGSASVAPNGGTLVLNIPIFVNQGASNTTPSINVLVIGQPNPGPTTYVVTQPIISPNIQIVVNQPVPSLVVGQTSMIPVIISNIGNGTGYGAFTVNLTLPSGIALGTLPLGWSLTNTVNNGNGTSTFTITNPNSGGIAAGTTITLNIPVTPGASVVNTTPSIIVIVAPIAGFTNPNSVTIVINNPVQTAAPDLSVIINQPSPSLVAGQTSNVGVVISNLGNVNISGNVSAQVTLPAGLSLSQSQLPLGWVLSAQVTNGSGSITYTLQNAVANILQGQSITLNIPVTPNSSLIGLNPTISVNLLQLLGEIVVINNSASLTVNQAVQAPASAPDLAIVIPAQSWTLSVGQTTNIAFNVVNLGSQNASGPLTATFSLPNNFTTNPTSFTTNGWSCVSSTNQVTCTTPNGLNVGGQANLVIPVLVNAGAAGTINPSFVMNVVQVSGETSVVNNTGIINYIGIVQVLTPDLAVNIPSQNWSLVAGQTTNITFNVSNIGSAAATAPNTVTMTLPANFTSSPTAFSTNGWGCNTVGNVVTCTNSSTIGTVASSSLVIPVQPLSAAGGMVNPSFVIQVSAASGETNLTNNQATINYQGTVQAGTLLLSAKALLQGSYDINTGLLRDDLRSQNLIPLAQPYFSTPGSPAYTFVNSGSETVSSTVLSVTGSNAIVDWVMVELRSATNPAQVLAAKPGLIQRDGDIVSSADGTSPLAFANMMAGNYHVVVRHRNHLGVMSATAVALSSAPTVVDLTVPGNLYKVLANGNYPANIVNTKALMWAGNTSGDDKVVFQGPGTDVDGSFFTIITDQGNTGLVTNYINSGYRMSDVNMDGKTIFQGPTNEPDIIFFNVILHPENTSILPNYIIKQHLP